MIEETEVLDSVPKSDPVQKDVAPIKDMEEPVVLKDKETNTYSSPVTVAEKNYIPDLTEGANKANAEATFSYTSQSKKNYDDTVNTYTVQSTGAKFEGEFKKQYGLGEEYKAKEGEGEYSWNKLAAEMAQTNYDQEAGQARYESIERKQEIDKAATAAWNNYFGSEYSARQTQEKMGWNGGQKLSSDLQVAFLQAQDSADMYTQSEMQKYGVETKLSVARMYAQAEQNKLALDYYQDAVDLALREADETGWYIPAECNELFNQQKVAQGILDDPFSTEAEKDRANKVVSACNAYYDKLGFQRGYAYDSNGKVVTEYYGIKTLSTLNYEETVRNNKIQENLQKQSIAAQNKANRLAELNLKVVGRTTNQTQYTEAVRNTANTNYKVNGLGGSQYMDDNGNLVPQPYVDGWYITVQKGINGGNDIYYYGNGVEGHKLYPKNGVPALGEEMK